MSKEQILRDVFYNPETGFGGATALYKKVKSQGINLKEVREWLAKQNVTQQTKKTTGKLQSFIPSKPLYQFQVDLIVLLQKKHHIKQKFNIHYALTCIDIFTKKADVQYIGMSKTGRIVADAMDKIINNLGIPETVFSDDGSEFIAVEFQNLMQKHKIIHRFTHLHAPFIESFHKTLKNKLHKYLQSIEKDGIQAILAALPKILKNYNNTEHTTTKTAPNDVNNGNEEQVLNNIIARSNHQIRKDVNIGDSVRLRFKHKSFAKGHIPVWTKGVFQVVDRQSVYYVVDGENKFDEPVRKDRMYLRSAIQKVQGDVETNPSLNQIKTNVEMFTENKDTIDDKKQEVIVQKMNLRAARERKKNTKYFNSAFV